MNQQQAAVESEVESSTVEQFYQHLRCHAVGRINAIPARDLVEALDLGESGDRILRALAHEANEQGLLVCTGNDGYYIPTSPDEVSETTGRLRSQAVKMIQRANHLEEIARQHFQRQATQLPLIG